MRSALIGLLTAAQLASSHTWVEQLMVIAPNGTLVGQPGFPRGNILRGTPAFSDPTMVNLIPPNGRIANLIEPSDLMCKVSQTSQTQTDGSPRLQAAPGSAIALRFQENGHVTLPDAQPGKPPNRGTVYVYGTSKQSPDDSFLAIHRQWTPNGSGGDGRGVLLSTRNFDDGQCYQVNGGTLSQQRQATYGHQFNQYMGNDLWCQQDIQIPADAPVGKPYTLYWVWDWPTLPGTPGFPQGKQEIYTTCMDIDIVAASDIETFNKAQGAPAYKDQAVDLAAIKAQVADIANPTAVTGQFIPFAYTPTNSKAAPSATSMPTTSSIAPPPPPPPPPSSTSIETALTSTPGSTIPFSASATGPVKGAASEASVSQATAITTGGFDFLTVHTASSTGPGVETQTFSVQPIIETSAPQRSGDGQGGFAFGDGRDNNGNGRGGESTSVTVSSIRVMTPGLTIHLDTTGNRGPEVTSAPNINNQAGLLTVTEYDAVTETVYQTLYETRYTKRDAGKYDSSSLLSPYPISSGFRTGSVHPPWASGHSSGYHGPFGNFTGTGGVAQSTGLPLWVSGKARPTGQAMDDGTAMTMTRGPRFMVEPTEISSSTTVVTIVPRSPKLAPPLIPVQVNGQSEDLKSTPKAISEQQSKPWPSMNIGDVDYRATSSGSPVFPTAITKTESMLTKISAAPQITAAPAIAGRSPEPQQDESSTAHSAFRLRARNPFVWLGWQQEPSTTISF